ncbi:MAG: SDR family oxidoreductase [Alphaproteobacteria bacterium]|nr:SDR family oxidoreductase [Alphaproteobacteria bacterium]
MPQAPGFRLDGRIALVTGAGRGIGAAIAAAFAAAGARVVVNDRDAAAADRTAAEIEGEAHHGDVGDEPTVDSLFDGIRARYGRIDILVNNAGTTRDETIFDTTLASWNEVLRVNLTSAFLCCRRAMEMMRAQHGGRILLLGSVTGHQGALLGHVHYAASKAGLHGVAKTLARTGAPLGITVNAIAPGIVETELLAATHGPAGVAALAKLVPLGLGAPDDIAGLAAYLASDAARHVTGAVFDINGGMYMR